MVRGFRHIFRRWRTRHRRAGVVMIVNADNVLRFSTTGRCDNGFFCRVLHNSRFRFCLFFWLDNDNISYVFSHRNGRVGGFCYRFGVSNNLLRHRRIAFGNQLRLFINRRGNHFRMRCLDLDDFRRLWFGDGLRLNGNVFYRLYRRLWFERYGRSDNLLFSDNRLWQRQICFTLLFNNLRFLRTDNRVADPDFTGRHFRRRAGDG